MTTDAGVHEADVLVVALGADYDMDATPGLAEGGNEFYSVAGAEQLAELLPAFTPRPRARRRLRGAVQVPAGAERGALMLDDYLLGARRPRRLRDLLRDPVRDAGAALAGDLAGAGRRLRRARHRASSPAAASASLDPARRVAVLDDGSELPFDLFLGVPKHRAPDVVIASGIDRATATCRSTRGRCETRFPGVYAVGDVATVGVPKAGVFAEGAARGRRRQR